MLDVRGEDHIRTGRSKGLRDRRMIVLFASAAVVVANIFVDIMYGVLDPRVRLH